MAYASMVLFSEHVADREILRTYGCLSSGELCDHMYFIDGGCVFDFYGLFHYSEGSLLTEKFKSHLENLTRFVSDYAHLQEENVWMRRNGKPSQHETSGKGEALFRSIFLMVESPFIRAEVFRDSRDMREH